MGVHRAWWMIAGILIGALLLLIVVVSVPQLSVFFEHPPSAGSLDAFELCGQMGDAGNGRLDSKYVAGWVSAPILKRYKEAVASLPESGARRLQKEAAPYIAEVKTGVVTQRDVDNIAYLVGQTLPRH